ncbi:unnamed protein product [Bursaphelenchus xylophilus]|uniref:(pine wood nematode) hypothetical protein n=1 Tax=Bursaphelenchus xylophilus TaxID=6326 RepID=A0A1I7RMT2_BURXY|nr:unnamed protein product [Bursaphelenchus xylophilus]CAG9125497.1 unnamed protein product [Bursaphelenchus xylophilus]
MPETLIPSQLSPDVPVRLQVLSFIHIYPSRVRFPRTRRPSFPSVIRGPRRDRRVGAQKMLDVRAERRRGKTGAALQPSAVSQYRENPPSLMQRLEGDPPRVCGDQGGWCVCLCASSAQVVVVDRLERLKGGKRWGGRCGEECKGRFKECEDNGTQWP